MESAVFNKPHYDEKGFDTYIFDEDHRMYGVFDGMGVSEGARGAANLVAALFGKERSKGLDAAGLGATIDHASRSIAVSFPNSGTTATITRIDSDGKLHYAHVGDSRLYVMSDKRIKQVTADEGIGNQLTNYCGPYTHGCVQIGILDADQWDSFMICSDGITGDWREQEIGDHLIEMDMAELDATEACQRIYQRSIKEDDKTIIVVKKGKK